MEAKRQVSDCSLLSGVPIEVQRTIVQYAGTAFAALVPFLPQTYFSQWDVVICLRDIMWEDEKRLEEYIEAFGSTTVVGTGGCHFMTLPKPEGDDRTRFNSVFLSDSGRVCILLLATYMPTPHILSFLMGRRGTKKDMNLRVPDGLNEEVLSSSNWAESARNIIRESIHWTDYKDAGEFVENVLLRNPEDIEGAHYRKYAERIILFNGDYRALFAIHNGEAFQTSLLGSVPCEEYATTIVREMGITLTEKQLIESDNVFLLNVGRMKSDFDYLIHIFHLSLKKNIGQDAKEYARPFSVYQYSCHSEHICEYIVRECFPHHMRNGVSTTRDQREIMKNILPCSDMSSTSNMVLCAFFGIDLHQHIIDFLRIREREHSYYGTRFQDLIGECISSLLAKEERGKGDADTNEKGEEKERKAETQRGKEYKSLNGPWVWREISPCDKFVSSLLESCIYQKAPRILHSCNIFIEYVTCKYTSFIKFSTEEARRHVSRICQNNLCQCHWSRRGLNPMACRTPLFIALEFGCKLYKPVFAERIKKYMRQGENLVDMLIDLQSGHAFDHVYEEVFDKESQYKNYTIISLFPKRNAPRCENRDIYIEEIDFGIFRIEDVDIKTMNYGRTLDRGRFDYHPDLVRAIRRAVLHAKRYRNVSENAMEVLKKMIYGNVYDEEGREVEDIEQLM